MTAYTSSTPGPLIPVSLKILKKLHTKIDDVINIRV